MEKPCSRFLHRVPTAVMKRTGRESFFDSHTKNPSPDFLISSSDPFGSEPAPPSPGAAGGILYVQSPPRKSPIALHVFDSQSPARARAVDPWGNTFVPETELEECDVDSADGDVVANDFEAAAWANYIAPDTYDGFEGLDFGQILNGCNPEEKDAEERATEEKAAEEKAAEEKVHAWEDAGYLKWIKAMHLMLERLGKKKKIGDFCSFISNMNSDACSFCYLLSLTFLVLELS